MRASALWKGLMLMETAVVSIVVALTVIVVSAFVAFIMRDEIRADRRDTIARKYNPNKPVNRRESSSAHRSVMNNIINRMK